MHELAGFFDESGFSERDEEVCIVAGLLTTAPRWAAFRRDWNRTRQRGRGIRYFKLHEARTATGEFEGWDRAAIDAKISDLTDVMLRHGQCHFAHGVRWDSFNEARSRAEHPGPDGWAHPYLLCVSITIRAVCSYLEELDLPHTPALSLTFDGQRGYESKAKRIASTYGQPWEDHGVPEYTLNRWLSGPLAFCPDDKKEPGIQVGDLIAGHYRDAIRLAAGRSGYETKIGPKLDGLTFRGTVAQQVMLDGWFRHLATLASGDFEGWIKGQERVRERAERGGRGTQDGADD